MVMLSLMNRLQKTVVLVGLMGAGKSAIGARVAKQLDVSFADSDALIEAQAGLTISDVFEQHGEPYFRELERSVIADDLAQAPHVLATGGGAFIEPATRELLLDQAIVVWLKAELDVLVERVSGKNTRPLLEKGDKRDIMESLMQARYPIYEQAHLVVNTSDVTHSVTVKQVIESVSEYARDAA